MGMDAPAHLYRTTRMRFVQTKFLKENLCALQAFMCALISRPVCMHTRAHSLEGTLLAIAA